MIETHQKFNEMNKSNSQKGLAPIAIVLIVLVLAGIVGGGVYLYNIKRVDTEKDLVKQSGLGNIGSALKLYYNKFNSFPSSLDLLLKDERFVGKYQSNKYTSMGYLYAVDSQKQRAHLGVKLSGTSISTITSDALASDVDFDSLKEGWLNGFSGVDPILDRTY